MDINVLRSGVTVAAFLVFIGILVWAYRPSRRAQFDDAAQLPFVSDVDDLNEFSREEAALTPSKGPQS